ncbi:citrulline utilization hydrolase CtlX [Sphingomicrobium flavum]|uniref:citrulline utilization hydrolase CtlX n=1 Tax=Sphingomicrobium flavum TaxID=1229164 RepID=UPI0021AE08F9|nr:arginine deiminase-related protein [Sphingomicrobium flavum]
MIDPPPAVVMIRPHHFRVNDETALDNHFQIEGARGDAANAYVELTLAAGDLQAAGVTVHLFEDEGRDTPDSVFPNNWFTTHSDGRIALYPMRAQSRRGERRGDIIAALAEQYKTTGIVDYSPAEADGHYLEGTGSLVLDRPNRVAYAALSPRTDAALFAQFCKDFGYRGVAFDTDGEMGAPIYHTNVMLTLGSGYALAGLDSIAAADRDRVAQALGEGGRDIISLSQRQLGEFAGNALELQGRDGAILAMSTRALAALSQDQLDRIEQHARILPISIPTIEKSGGSVRCTLAGVHLRPR